MTVFVRKFFEEGSRFHSEILTNELFLITNLLTRSGSLIGHSESEHVVYSVNLCSKSCSSTDQGLIFEKGKRITGMF